MSETKSNLDRAIAYLKWYRFSGCTETEKLNEALDCLGDHIKERNLKEFDCFDFKDSTFEGIKTEKKPKELLQRYRINQNLLRKATLTMHGYGTCYHLGEDVWIKYKPAEICRSIDYEVIK